MLWVSASTASIAWRQCCVDLLANGYPVAEKGFFREESASIEISNIKDGLHDSASPMSQEDIEIVSRYLVSGECEDMVNHEWTKVYRKRLFVEEPQIQRVISYLRIKRQGVRAQASLWNSAKDLYSECAPCLQVLWFRIVGEDLHLHVHMRTSDCYRKLLMNINQFIGLQEHVALEVQARPGKYVQFIDSLHFREVDREVIAEAVRQFKQDPRIRLSCSSQ